MKIAFACDHGGYELKQKLMQHLDADGYDLIDFGCDGTESVDYSDYAFPAAEAVAKGACDRAILVCTTGIGMCICANKVDGIRCALCTSERMAVMTRKHNDTNVLALGAENESEETAQIIVDKWLKTAFEGKGERHERRINKIFEYEQSH